MPAAEQLSTKDQYSKVPTNEKTEVVDTPSSYGYGIRHIQMGIVFICLSVCYAIRGHLGVTIVAMTSHEHTGNVENTTNINETDVGNNNFANNIEIGIEMNSTAEVEVDNNKWNPYRTYDWPKPVQETILSSFFLGYFLMAFPNALISQRWGGKVQLQISWLTLWGGWKAMSACRVAQGLAQAGTFPGIQTLLAKWVPVCERATLSSYVYTGSTVGNIIGFQLGGLLADSSWGWPSTYWVLGVLCIACFGFLTVFGAATPLVHTSVSTEEKNYILGQTDPGIVQKRTPAPWKAIATSRPVWANFTTAIGSVITYVFLLTQVPSFFHYILGVDIKNSGILSSLAFVGSLFSSIFFGLFSDFLTNKNILSVKTTRRVFNSISQVGAALSLICVLYAPNTTIAVICIVFAMVCLAAIHSGWMLNQIDMSPNYSGTLMSISNTFANCAVMIVPVLVSNIVVDVRNPSQWRTILCIMAGVAFLTNLVFVSFLSVEVQPWNEGRIDDAENQDAKSVKVKPQ